MRALFTLVFCLLVTQSALAASRDSLKQRAFAAFKDGEFKRAIPLFERYLAHLDSGEQGTAVEREAREHLVLALYNAGKKNDAAEACRKLRAHFPDHVFNPDEVMPDARAFFASRCPAETAAPAPITPSIEPASQPSVEPAPASSEAPRLVQEAPARKWSAAYLVPLGIGQFLAGSPVRGAIFLAAEVLLGALNVVGTVLYFRELRPNGYFRDVERARAAQIMMDVGFFGLAGALVAGLLDGAFGEP